MIDLIKRRAAQRMKDLAALAVDVNLMQRIHELSWQCISALREGNKIVLFGNGGSAAQAQHWAAELVGQFKKKTRPAMPAIALTSDTAILTALANDLGYENIFALQLGAHVKAGDIAIGISTSGRSANVLKALAAAPSFECMPWLLTGQAYEERADDPTAILRCPGEETAAIQESHLFVAHLICEAIDDNVG